MEQNNRNRGELNAPQQPENYQMNFVNLKMTNSS